MVQVRHLNIITIMILEKINFPTNFKAYNVKFNFRSFLYKIYKSINDNKFYIL